MTKPKRPKVDWHPWPDEKPPRRTFYLITQRIYEATKVIVRFYDSKNEADPWGFDLPGIKCIA